MVLWVWLDCSLVEILYSKMRQGGKNGRAQSTTSAAPSSPPTQQANLSCTGGGHHQNRFYAFYAFKDQDDTHDILTGKLRAFNLDVYDFLDPGATFSFVTPYIAVNFDVSPKTL